MINLFLKFCVIPIIISCSVIPLILSNLLIIWFIIEINNFIFITLRIIKINNKKLIFLYFIVQIIASFIFIFSLISNPIISNEYSNTLLILALIIKLGIPPFHLWIIIITKSINWWLLFLTLTIQKIIPLNVLFLSTIKPIIFMLIIIISIIIPSIKIFTITELKTLMTYSSINQTGWIVRLIFIKNSIWIIYIGIYIIIISSISFIIHESKISIKFYQVNFKNFNLILTILIINIAGLPPLTFFIFKWIRTFIIISQTNLIFIIVCIIFNSLIITFIYIKIISWIFFNNKLERKIKIISIKFKITKIILIILTPLIPLILI